MDWNKLWETIKILLGDMWTDLWPTIRILITEQGRTALTSAKNIVIQIQQTMPDASGQEKFNAALTQLTGLLLAQGITLGIGILRVVVQMAYEKMVAAPEVEDEARALQGMLSTPPPDPMQGVTP
jgi:hypothetical protein